MTTEPRRQRPIRACLVVLAAVLAVTSLRPACAAQQNGNRTQTAPQSIKELSTKERNKLAELLTAIEYDQGIEDHADLIVLELDKGPVIIRALRDQAPMAVRRVKKLLAAGAYDNARFAFVRHGYAAEIALPGETDGKGTGKPVPLEISKTPFTRGIVGMSHPPKNVNGGTGAFFIALGDDKELDQKYTVWGRVIYGLETLDKLAEGNPPEHPDVILHARSADAIIGK